MPKHNTFPGLEVELIVLIAEFLSHDDVICISLCSRRLFDIFRLRDDLRSTRREDKLSLLTRLGRDLPKFVVCYECKILHKFDASDKFLPAFYYRQRVCQCPEIFNNFCGCSIEKLYLGFFGYCFSFLHLQLAMKRFYHGPENGISTEDLSHIQVKLHDVRSGIQIPLLSSVDAHICSTPPGLILRVQQIQFIPHRPRYLPYRDQFSLLMDQQSPWRKVSFCNHEGDQSYELLNEIVRAYRAGEKAPSASFTCNICDTEFLAEISECESGLALVITKWFSLGAGLTPDDPQWRKHQDRAIGTIQRTMKAGNAQICFEGTSTDSLRSRNIAYLKNYQFKESLAYESEQSIWYLDRRDHPTSWLTLLPHLVWVSFLCLLGIWLSPSELQPILCIVLILALFIVFIASILLWQKEEDERDRESRMGFRRRMLHLSDIQEKQLQRWGKNARTRKESIGS